MTQDSIILLSHEIVELRQFGAELQYTELSIKYLLIFFKDILTKHFSRKVAHKVHVQPGPSIAYAKVSDSICQRHYFLFLFIKSEKKIITASSIDCAYRSPLWISRCIPKSSYWELLMWLMCSCISCLFNWALPLHFALAAHFIHRCSLFWLQALFPSFTHWESFPQTECLCVECSTPWTLGSNGVWEGACGFSSCFQLYKHHVLFLSF